MYSLGVSWLGYLRCMSIYPGGYTCGSDASTGVYLVFKVLQVRADRGLYLGRGGVDQTLFSTTFIVANFLSYYKPDLPHFPPMTDVIAKTMTL